MISKMHLLFRLLRIVLSLMAFCIIGCNGEEGPTGEPGTDAGMDALEPGTDASENPPETEEVPLPPLEVLVTPNSGLQGETLNLTLVSSQGGFQSTTTVSFGESIQVQAYELEDSNRLHVRIFIPYDAVCGFQDVDFQLNDKPVNLAQAFQVLPTEEIGGLVLFSLQKQSLWDSEHVSAIASFTNYDTDVLYWFFGYPNPPAKGELVFGCRREEEDCFVPPPRTPYFLDAGERITILSKDTPLFLDRFYFNPNSPYDLVYVPFQPVDLDYFQFNSEYSFEVTGGAYVPPFSTTFKTPRDFKVLSHGFSPNLLDVVRGQDLRISWSPPELDPGESSRVLIFIAGLNPFSGLTDWLYLNAPDTGEAVIPSSSLDLLSEGTIQTMVMNETIQQLRMPTVAPIHFISQVLYQGIGKIYPEGTKLVYLEPRTARQGETLDIEIYAYNTQFAQNLTTIEFTQGIQVNELTVSSPTLAKANVTILDARFAPFGPRDVYLQTTGIADEQFTLKDGFVIAPAIAQCTKNDSESTVLVSGDVACGKISTPQEVDVFSFQGVSGQAVVAEVLTAKYGSQMSAIYRLYGDEARQQMLYEFEWNEGVVATLLTETKTYYLTIEDENPSASGEDYFYTIFFNLFTPTVLSNQECPADVMELADGFYMGNTESFTNTHTTDDEEYVGCRDHLDANGFAGKDTTYLVTLEPGQTLVAWLENTFSDSSLYLLQNCMDIQTCLVGADYKPWRRPETIAYKNSSGEKVSLYLVLDVSWFSLSSYLPGGEFFLQVYRFP